MFCKLYYSNILKFDFLTKYNYFSNKSVIELDYLGISLVPTKFNSLKEYNLELFQYFFLLEWLIGSRPFIKKLNYFPSNIFLMYCVNLRNLFFFNFLLINFFSILY